MNIKFQILILMICNVSACKSEERTIIIEITHDEDFTIHDFDEQKDVIKLGDYDFQDWPVSNSQPVETNGNDTTNLSPTDANVPPVSDTNVTSVNATETEYKNEINRPDGNNTTKLSFHDERLQRKDLVDLAANSERSETQNIFKTYSNTSNLTQDTKTNISESLQTRKRLFNVLRRFIGNHKERKSNQGVRSSDDAVRSLISRRRMDNLWRVLMRRKRQVNIDLEDLANEDWVITTPSLKNLTGRDDGQDDFQIISDEDKRNAKKAKYKATIAYVGTTLVSVATFSALAFCFLRDPKGFIVAFGTGCPCLLVVMPCLRKCFDRYLNIGKMVKRSLNTYMPGIIVHEDGTLERYEPTPEELECVADIIDEIMD